MDDGKEDEGDEDSAAISLCFCSAVTSAATDWANEAMTDTKAAVVAVALSLWSADVATCCPGGAMPVLEAAVWLPAAEPAAISLLDESVGSEGAGEVDVRVVGECCALSSPADAAAERASDEECDDDECDCADAGADAAHMARRRLSGSAAVKYTHAKVHWLDETKRRERWSK